MDIKSGMTATPNLHHQASTGAHNAKGRQLIKQHHSDHASDSIHWPPDAGSSASKVPSYATPCTGRIWLRKQLIGATLKHRGGQIELSDRRSVKTLSNTTNVEPPHERNEPLISMVRLYGHPLYYQGHCRRLSSKSTQEINEGDANVVE
ncbi:MAG: hypothetical protein Q9162_000065 [Coniocarpon cinnabarinum]